MRLCVSTFLSDNLLDDLIFKEWMMGEGWANGWMGGWMGGWMDGWMDGWVDGWMDGRMDGWNWMDLDGW